MTRQYSAVEISFTRLLALCERNRNKFDEKDKEILDLTHYWFYNDYRPKGPKSV